MRNAAVQAVVNQPDPLPGAPMLGGDEELQDGYPQHAVMDDLAAVAAVHQQANAAAAMAAAAAGGGGWMLGVASGAPGAPPLALTAPGMEGLGEDA